jgi:hypothetical protein
MQQTFQPPAFPIGTRRSPPQNSDMKAFSGKAHWRIAAKNFSSHACQNPNSNSVSIPFAEPDSRGADRDASSGGAAVRI